MKRVALVAFILLAAPATAQEQELGAGLSNEDLARLTLAISQEFDLLEQRLTAWLDEVYLHLNVCIPRGVPEQLQGVDSEEIASEQCGSAILHVGN